MITMSIKINRNLMIPALKKISAQLKAYPQELYEKFVELTPEDTGFAKKNTKLVNSRRIAAKYTYAAVLDKGRHMTNRGMRGSKQAPKGMTRPAREWAQKRIRQIIGIRR